MSLPRIFVYIASYRDQECQWTLRDLFGKARHPERVFVGVCWQTDPDKDQACFSIETRPEQVRSVHFHIREARGVGWARLQAQQLWQGEEYVLQIDSHMRFVPDWDEEMLGMLALCDSPDPVLTIYPPGYTPPDELHERRQPHVQCIKGFSHNGLPEFTHKRIPAGVEVSRPQPTAAYAAGFMFGSSRILREVPYDPDIYFNGEEPSLAVRLWTHGFDLYSPQKTVIYHYYQRADGSRHWNDAKKWVDLHKRTMKRLKALCEPASCTPEEVAELGRYGLGMQRSLDAYERFSGISFTGKTLAAYARAFPFVAKDAESYTVVLSKDLAPAPDIHLFILGDEGLLFVGGKGEFYGLNSAATMVWCALEEGMDWCAIQGELAAWRGISGQEAQRELRMLAAHWLGQGVLLHAGREAFSQAPEPEEPEEAFILPPRFEPAYFDFREHTYRLLGVSIRIRYGDRELKHWIHPVIAHLETDAEETPEHHITVARVLNYFYLYCDDRQKFWGGAIAELAPRVKFEILRCATSAQEHVLQLHAGAVVAKGALVLFPARSGKGKTTLTARLVAAGCEYFTDEVVLLERGTGRIRPMPVSFCVKEDGTELLERYYPGLSELPQYDRQDGIQVRYLPPPASSLPQDRAERAALIVFRRYVENAPLRCRPLSPVEAFGRLMEECVAIPKPLDLADAAVLVDFIEGVRCHEMSGGDLDAGAACVLDLCSALAAPAADS